MQSFYLISILTIAQNPTPTFQDELVCFMAGSLALGAHHGLDPEHLEMGKKLARTCYEMHKQMPTGLSPEIVYFNMVPTKGNDIIVKVSCLCALL